jgi:hypothetical protein
MFIFLGMKQVGKCMYNMTFLMLSPGFDFFQMKYWKNETHRLVTIKNKQFHCFFIVRAMMSSGVQRIMGN